MDLDKTGQQAILEILQAQGSGAPVAQKAVTAALKAQGFETEHVAAAINALLGTAQIILVSAEGGHALALLDEKSRVVQNKYAQIHSYIL